MEVFFFDKTLPCVIFLRKLQTLWHLLAYYWHLSVPVSSYRGQLPTYHHQLVAITNSNQSPNHHMQQKNQRIIFHIVILSSKGIVSRILALFGQYRVSAILKAVSAKHNIYQMAMSNRIFCPKHELASLVLQRQSYDVYIRAQSKFPFQVFSGQGMFFLWKS